MKIIILHHIEPLWEPYLNPDVLLPALLDHLETTDYDKVILTTLEGDFSYLELAPYITDRQDWSYAWDGRDEQEVAENFGLNPENIIAANGHEWAYLYPWIRDLMGCDVTLTGGADGECLQDLRDSLDYLQIPYQEIRNCIY